MSTEEFTADLSNLHLYELARLVRVDWRDARGNPRVWFGAAPYLGALEQLVGMDDSYGLDPAREIVAYFLANAAQWRGPVARAVKDELKRRLKS